VESLQKLQRELDGKARDAALTEEKLKAKGESLDMREMDLARRGGRPRQAGEGSHLQGGNA
jgi:hypothetical protein